MIPEIVFNATLLSFFDPVRRYLDDPSVTDCISFPMDSDQQSDPSSYRLLGDVFICPQVAKNYASRVGGDSYRELSLYLVHGLLHLIGYDDIKEKDRRAMRAAEERHMRNLHKKQLILSP